MVGKKCGFDTISTFSYSVIFKFSHWLQILYCIKTVCENKCKQWTKSTEFEYFGRIERAKKLCMYTNGPGTANYLYFLVFKMFQCFLYFKNVTCDLVTYNITSCEELTHWKRP